jgi:ankyrin repeat protein
VVELLLAAKGVSVNQENGQGITPLFIAAQNGHVAVVDLLLAAGADIELSMHGNGWEPLFVAAWSGHDAAVRALLARGANRDAVTTRSHLGVAAGSTALSVAEAKGHEGVLEDLA